MHTHRVGKKIKTLEELVPIVQQLKAEGKRVVLAHGVFDLMHMGHIYYLDQAADYGDVLIVSVLDDTFVHKGPNRPAFAESIRQRSVASLGYVSFVVPCRELGPYKIIRQLRPDIYARGEDVMPLLDDPTSGLNRDKEALDEVGGKMEFLQIVPLVHSTSLLNRYFPPNPPEVMAFLDDFKKKYDYASVVGHLQSLRNLKVLVVGETIIDEYCYAAPLPGTPSKSPVIAAEVREREMFAGGVLACANHIAGLCETVDVVTYLGETCSREEFIRGKLQPNVRPEFFICPNRPTITKTRYIDPAYLTRLFELYEFDRKPIPTELEDSIDAYLKGCLADYDLVLVADYGHKLLSKRLIETIRSGAAFLAVNAQTNAGNLGFNYATKYQGADYLCVDEREARLAVHDDESDVKDVARSVRSSTGAASVVLTLGRRGALFLDNGQAGIIPSFTTSVVDTVGAGDAFLAFSSLCAARGLSSDLTAFVGNVAGSLAVEVIGNKTPISSELFFQRLKYLLD
ncbi:MAG: hypothetical protein A2941_00565 [Candidatus Yanofskybacteria bacterium RIFCSPLOWO2_01_FULL_49_17]|uniref:Cytidyltransferase-like domain-containing protein n=1 Tax=Candidatus Yanofskybacteria bacterium RIFCSPLOWO2_01_FULL_49_17 TaxID=1802700 RepID=A0A1F8GQU8_9BACT|nr:MAG: hypothetical protein A2941_00565 [Candidatus Yanofskybacteria bacterium RIFCSPLOWO2_01_FULL_49_17]